MSLSQGDFDAHGVWQAEKTTTKLLASTADALTEDAVDDVETIDRIRVALADVRSIGSIEPWRITGNTAPLDALHSVLTSLQSELAALKEAPTVSRQIQLESVLDQLVAALKPFPLYLVQTEAAVEAKEALKAQREFLKETVEWLHRTVDESTDSVEKLRETIGAEETKISEQVKRLDDALNTQNNTFTTRVEEWKEKSDGAAASIVAKGDQHLAALIEMEEQSRNLVDATSRHTITAEYGDYAKSQERAAFWWSVGAVASAIGGFVYLAIVLAGIHSASVPETIVKATVSSLVVLGAGFMSHESSGHRKEARDARRTQLDLNALDPFLTKLGEDEANDLRREFAQKIFGRPLANDKSQKPYEWILGKLQRDKKASNDDSAVDA
jgi:gas vesicle protein